MIAGILVVTHLAAFLLGGFVFRNNAKKVNDVADAAKTVSDTVKNL